MRWSLTALVICSLVLAGTAAAQVLPFEVDADTVTYDTVAQLVTARGNVRMTFGDYRLFADVARYDLRTQVVVAAGRVRLVHPRGEELRGETLTYNVRSEEGILEPSEGVVDRAHRVYLKGERLEFSRSRFVSHKSTVTMCDPRQPLLYIGADRIEVIPDSEIVASNASAYLAGRRLFTLPSYTISLVPGERRSPLPGFGHDPYDGYWVDYRIPWNPAGSRGHLHLKYGTLSGFSGFLTLEREAPPFVTSARLGRTLHIDERPAYNLLPYDMAEFGAASAPFTVAGTPLQWSLKGTAGWYSELQSGVATTRLDGEVSLGVRPIAVGRGLTLSAQGAFRLSGYGTGDLRTVASFEVAMTRELGPHTSVSAGYAFASVWGSTPLQIDVVDPARTTSVSVRHAVVNRYAVLASVAHNAAVPETVLSGGLSLAVTPTLELGVSAAYNTRLSAFDDIDYTLRRVCDCIDVVVRYRQVRQEISIEFGLVGITKRQGAFVPRATRPDSGGERVAATAPPH